MSNSPEQSTLTLPSEPLQQCSRFCALQRPPRQGWLDGVKGAIPDLQEWAAS